MSAVIKVATILVLPSAIQVIREGGHMARSVVYVRSVNAVFTDVQLDEYSNRFKYGLKIKKEPMDESDVTLSVDTNVRDEDETIGSEDKHTNGSNRAEVPVLPQESVNSGNGNHNNRKRKRATGGLRHKHPLCTVCFVPFKNRNALKMHTIIYSKSFKCQRCNIVFNGEYLWRRHLMMGCDLKVSSGLACYICNKNCYDKKTVQSHLFHCHGDFIHFGEGVVKTSKELDNSNDTLTNKPNNSSNAMLEELYSDETTAINVPAELPKQSNGSNDTVMKELNCSSNAIAGELGPSEIEATCSEAPEQQKGPENTAVGKLSDSNVVSMFSTSSMKLNDPCRTPSGRSTPSRRLHSPYSTPSKGLNNCYDTPSKKMRQTILTEFITVYKEELKEEPKEEAVTPKKLSVTENTSVSCEQSTDELSKSLDVMNISTPVNGSKRSNADRQPFVTIHMDSNTMMSMLNENKQAKLDTPTNSRSLFYNLRSMKPNACVSPYFEKYGYKLTREYGKNYYMTRRKQKMTEKELKFIFQCKECVVGLERCDYMLRDMDKGAVTQEKNFEGTVIKTENVEKSAETSIENSTELEESITDTLMAFEQKFEEYDDNIDVNQESMFKCHVCRKEFHLWVDLLNHMESSHIVYMSSICNARYTLMKNLLKHYFRQHITYKENRCCVCYEMFDSRMSLKRHLTLHCLKITPSQYDTLPVDVEVKCLKIKRYKCDNCQKRFLLESCLDLHKKGCRIKKRRLFVAIAPKKSTLVSVPPSNINSSVTRDINSSVTSNINSSVTSNINSSVTNTQELSYSSVLHSSHKEPIQVCEPEQMTPKLIEANNTVTTDAVHSVPQIHAKQKSLINGVVRVKGYQDDMPNKAKFFCGICDKQFQTFQNLCIHESTFCRPANNKCTVCGTGFTTKKLLQVHMLATHSPFYLSKYSYFCKFCNQGFNKAISLRIHERHFHTGHAMGQALNLNHQRKVSPICSICNLLFQSYKHFIEHNMYYYRGQIFECKLCNKSFQGMFRFHHHIKLDHYSMNPQKPYVYKCNLCNEGFYHESHFHAHKFHVHSEDTVPLLNTMQDHNYALTSNTVATSEELTIIKLKMYSCEICGMNYTNRKDLMIHQIEYSVTGQFQCVECSRKFRTSSILAKHYSLNHTGSDSHGNLKCNICEEVVTSEASMFCHKKHFHMENIYPTEKNVALNAVDINQRKREVLNKSTSVIDKFISVTERCACLTCGMQFPTKISLKEHLFEFSDIGMYSCAVCERKFVDCAQLEQHKMKHFIMSNESSRHRCPICNESFEHPVNVRMHVLHLHRYEMYSYDCNATNESDVTDNVQKNSAVPFANSMRENIVSCPECYVGFSSKKNLMKHRSRYANTGDYQCIHCNRKFPWQTTLEQHLRKHTGDENQLLKHQCLNCTEKFRSSVSLYSHIIHSHNGVRPDRGKTNDKDRSDGNNANGGNTFRGSAVTASAAPAYNVNAEDANKDNEVDKEKKAVEETRLSYEEYYMCLMCKSKFLTLRTFQEHFKTVHKGNSQSETTAAQSDDANKKHCVTCKMVFNDEKSFDEHMLKHRKTDRDSLTNKNESEQRNVPSEKNSNDAIEIIWEKKSSPVECIVIDDDEDSNISVGVEDIPPPPPPPPLYEQCKLRVKSFAKIFN